MKRFFITHLLLLMATCIGYGQDIQKATLQWKANSYFDVLKGITAYEPSVIISYPDRVEWKSADGATKQTFKIAETNGTWPDLNQEGEIVYEVGTDGKDGKHGLVQFRKQGPVLTVWLITFDKDTQSHFQFTIESVTNL